MMGRGLRTQNDLEIKSMIGEKQSTDVLQSLSKYLGHFPQN